MGPVCGLQGKGYKGWDNFYFVGGCIAVKIALFFIFVRLTKKRKKAHIFSVIDWGFSIERSVVCPVVLF